MSVDQKTTMREFTVPQLSGAWCLGFNAYHQGVPFERGSNHSAGEEQLAAQWRDGWLEAKKEDANAN